MADVFISYAREDRPKAERLARALHERGWSVWWDPVIPPGKSFADVIEKALEAARCVVVLWSSHSVSSYWVKTEASEGLTRQILVPALLEEVRIPIEFRRLHAANLLDWGEQTSHDGLDALLNAVATTLGDGAPAPAAEVSGPVPRAPATALDKATAFDNVTAADKSTASDKVPRREPLELTPTRPVERTGETTSPVPVEATPGPRKQLVRVLEARSRAETDPASHAEAAQSPLSPEPARLREELELPKTTHKQRAEIGDRLAEIGDPRPGVGLGRDGLPDIVWCEIPGGKVTLEGVKGDFAVQPFLIAKYPITYWQYKAFLDDAHGYRDERWWRNLRHEAVPGEQFHRTGNCPAENVSLWDATAYCRWLSERSGLEVRLPTEPEWQQAATGGDPKNEYPWGKWVDGRANTAESGLNRTTAVGMYPRSASRHEVLDLSGNVWEWCMTNVRVQEPGWYDEVWRVVRGGSWNYNRDYARCAFRDNAYPDNRGPYLGFRVVQVPRTARKRRAV